EVLNQRGIDAGDAADAAEVDPFAVAAGQEQLFAAEVLERAEVLPDGPPAQPADLRLDAGVDLFQQDADDDVERVVVGVAAALALTRFQAGLGHGAVDRLAAAVDQDGPHADRLHEDDILQRGPQRLGVFHGAAAEFDDRQLVAETANVAEGLDQH